MNAIRNETGRPTILVVDDTPGSIDPIVHCLLEAGYRTRIATDGARAISLSVTPPQPDLILLDILMPGLDGFEVCRRLKRNPLTAGIPVIFLTILTDEVDEQQGFDAGAVDYIAKPISPPLVLARVRTHLRLKTANDELRDRNLTLRNQVEERTRAIGAIQDATIMAMASLAETRDEETGNHIRRTQLYVQALATRLRENPRYAPELSEEEILLMYKSAPLHDIGKIGIPDRILLKPGKLTPDEFELMKTHTRLGHNAILRAESLIGFPITFLRHAREIALLHHERWDGSGYPLGLAGTDIPLSARLMAVADVYDALISRRIYKDAFAHETAAGIITAGRGTHFDPEIVDAFLAIEDSFREIARQFADPVPSDAAHTP